MRMTRGLLSVLFIAIASAAPAAACEFLDLKAAQLASLSTTTAYLVAAIVAAAALAALQAYRRRWSPVMLGIAASLLGLHPRWTVAPMHGPDCAFANVEASIAVLVIIGLLLAVEVCKLVRSR